METRCTTCWDLFVISIALEVEITNGKEPFYSEESNDEEKFRMVFRMMANMIWVESRMVDTAKSVDNGKTCPAYCGIWCQWSKTKEARDIKVVEKVSRLARSPRSGRRT